MFRFWIRNLIKMAYKNPSRSRHRRRPRLLPVVEPFEDRLVPTTMSIPTNLVGVQGQVAQVPVNVDTLNDPGNLNSGMDGADIVVFYNPAEFSVSGSDVNIGVISSPNSGDPSGTGNQDGYSPSSTNGWSAAGAVLSPGLLDIQLSNDGSGFITATGGGSLVTINFHTLSNAPLGPTMIDLAADTQDGPPLTDMTFLEDNFFSNYTLNPAPQDNTTLSPYSYTGSDPDDGIVNVIAPAPHFYVNAPQREAPGAGFQFTVTAENADDSTNTAYAGTVTFSAGDTGAVLPANSTLISGVGTFSATLATLGSQTLTATDTQTATLTGSSSAIVVAVPAPHFEVDAPANVTVGNAFSFTVTAENANNSVNTSYSGTVQLYSSDSAAILPADTTLSGGIGYFAALLETGGTQYLTATDFNLFSITGTSEPISVAAVTPHFLIEGPTSATPGNAFSYTVVLLDSTNNTATGYIGTVHFTSSDSHAVLPPDATLNGGVGYFAAVLETPGQQTITATDTSVSTLTGTSGSITVLGPVTHFSLSAPSGATGGVPFLFTVTALDAGDSTDTLFSGSVHFASTDLQATLPADERLVAGLGTFSATLATAGSQTLSAIDVASTSVTGASNNIAVSTGNNNGQPATHFFVGAASTATAGNPLLLVVTADTQANGVATGYNGTVVLTSSDSQAALPATPLTLSNGVGYFAVSLKTAGTQTFTVVDATASSLTGISNAITVKAAAASHFSVSAALPTYPGIATGPTSFASTGVGFALTVTAVDPYGNTASNYAGTVHFTSSATGSTLPPAGTLTAGTAVFSATLATAGSQAITATDSVSSSITGASAVVTRGLVVTSFSATPTGFTASFNKSFNPSTVNLYSAETALPDDATLTTTGTVVSIKGSLLFNSTDNGITFVKTAVTTAQGTFNPTTGLLSTGNYTVTLRSYSAGSSGFQDALNGPLDGANSGSGASNFQITFSVAPPPVAVGIPDFARGPSNTDAIFFSNTLSDGSTFALSYTNPSANPTTGTATVTFSTIGATLQANIQAALTTGGLATQIGSTSNIPNSVVVATNDLSSGANVLVTFQGSLATATSRLLSSNTTGVSISLAPINLPNNMPGNGIPIALTNGLNVTSGSFTLQYNPSLLSISGVTSRLTVGGATFSLVSNVINNASSATAVLSLSSPSRISASTTSIVLGSLLATVPISATASYGAKQLLHFSSEQLNGTSGSITVTNQDAVEVAAYFGNATLTGTFGLEDASGMARVGSAAANAGLQTLPGFQAVPNLDPIIIGNITTSGTVTTTDAGIMNQEVGGTPKAQIPTAPSGLSFAPAGPDPSLSVPPSLEAMPGETLIVPVNIDSARPEGSTGMIDAVLALTYDPLAFSVSPADVQLGTVPGAGAGWQLNVAVNSETGQIGIEVYSNGTAIQSTAGGSIVTISMHAVAATPTGTAVLDVVPFVDPTGGLRVYQTQVSDSVGDFKLTGVQTPVNTIELPATNPPAVPDGSGEAALEIAQTPVAANPAPAVSSMPTALLEQVFGQLEQTAWSNPLPTAISQLPGAYWLPPAAFWQTPASEYLSDDSLANMVLGVSNPAPPQDANWLGSPTDESE